MNKSLIEDKLKAALDSFGNGIPRLTEMADLVNKEKTRARLVELLASVVEFAREATMYYGTNCLSRFPHNGIRYCDSSVLERNVYVLFYPPEHLDEMQSRITSKANEIKEDALLWSYKSIHTLEASNMELKNQNAEQLKKIGDLMDQLAEIKRQNADHEVQVAQLTDNFQGNK